MSSAQQSTGRAKVDRKIKAREPRGVSYRLRSDDRSVDIKDHRGRGSPGSTDLKLDRAHDVRKRPAVIECARKAGNVIAVRVAKVEPPATVESGDKG